MATPTRSRIVCVWLLSVALWLGAPFATYGSDAESATDGGAHTTLESETEAPGSCCPEGYECAAIDTEHDAGADKDGKPPACHGILTCTFFVVGHVIALPFRALGAVFRIVI